MGLKEYHQKRDFEETSEPKGRVVSRQKGPLRFVVQKHEASHLHYDFRLEVDGVLKSWAVPKGPSMKPADKRLAIQVEDHPFDYRTFEGTIPEGSYGAGTVMLWDEGTYHAIDASSRKESEQLMEEGLEEGRLQFVLDGEKLKGEFSLLRLKGQEKQWLLVKKKDKYATSEDITLEDRSVISQRSMEEIAGDQPAAKSPARKKKSREKAESASPKGIEQTNLPKNAKPMLATLVEAPFDRKDWIFETKWDGYRALAAVDKGKVDLYSRSFQSFNKRYKPVIDDLKNLKISALLDGEIVILDEEGRSSFQLVQNYQRTQTGNIIYYVFDLLYLEGYDIRHLPLIERKDLLKKIISPDWEHVKFCEHIEEKGIRYFEKAVKKGLEGIIAKNSQSPYKSGRSHDWLKIKGHYRQEAVICGFTEPKGTREKFGALVLGVYKNGILTYVGHTGSGFNRKQLANIHARLTPLIQSKCPFPETPKTRFPVTWVKPKLVCEVSFAEWTQEGIMRQAIFIDFREDKKPEEVVREKEMPVQQVLSDPDPKPKKGKIKGQATPELTNLDKVYWPKEGYTKGDLIQYYQEISSVILPYLKNRPETLHRFPNGIDKPGFFQKDVEQVPDWIKTEVVKHENRDVDYLIINDQASLLYVANLGCIELNPFLAQIQTLDYPDFMVLDLDPEGVGFDKVIEVALEVRKVLADLGIEGFCKTSGATGLHIYVPMGAQYTYDETAEFGKLIANLVYQRLPKITSLERRPNKRQKKVYLDYFRNYFGQTVAAPYCVRPRPGAPVSTPLKWNEVRRGLDPTAFTIKTILKRLDKIGDIFTPVLGPGIDIKAVLEKLSI